MSQLGPKELQKHHDEEGSSHDGGLDSILGLSARLGGPVELDIANDETAYHCTN